MIAFQTNAYQPSAFQTTDLVVGNQMQVAVAGHVPTDTIQASVPTVTVEVPR